MCLWGQAAGDTSRTEIGTAIRSESSKSCKPPTTSLSTRIMNGASHRLLSRIYHQKCCLALLLLSPCSWKLNQYDSCYTTGLRRATKFGFYPQNAAWHWSLIGKPCAVPVRMHTVLTWKRRRYCSSQECVLSTTKNSSWFRLFRIKAMWKSRRHCCHVTREDTVNKCKYINLNKV